MRRAVLALAIALAAVAPVPSASARAAHPPIVMLVWDEFSWSSLLNATGGIDATRYPNIAKLARGATVFPRYTAPGDETGPVMSSLLAGAPFSERANPVYRSQPRNLFTRLHPTYRMVVNEEVTGFCPASICPGNRIPTTRQQILTRVAHARTSRIDAWLRRIGPTNRPTLFFKHALLPHGPAAYLPSGQRYNPNPSEPIRGLNTPGSFGDPWFVRQSWQRYLFQVELVDRCIGRLVAKLRATHLYDKSLIIMTADNGEAFGFVGSDPHRTDAQTAADVAATPLIMKLPGQRKGTLVRHHVRTIDVLPTILRLAGLSTRGLSGRPGLRARGGIPSGIDVADDNGRNHHFSPGAFTTALRAILRRKAQAFSRGLYDIGPSPELVGKRVAALKVTRAAGLRATFTYRDLLRKVNPTGPLVPVDVIAKLTGRRLGRGVPFAVSVNGTVAATGWTSLIKGSPTVWATAFVRTPALRRGANTVQILLIGKTGALQRVP